MQLCVNFHALQSKVVHIVTTPLPWVKSSFKCHFYALFSAIFEFGIPVISKTLPLHVMAWLRGLKSHAPKFGACQQTSVCQNPVCFKPSVILSNFSYNRIFGNIILIRNRKILDPNIIYMFGRKNSMN